MLEPSANTVVDRMCKRTVIQFVNMNHVIILQLVDLDLTVA